MLKLIAILIGCSLTLAVSVQAEQANQTDANKKNPAPKSKTVQKQKVAPKQQTAPKTQHPNAKVNPDVSKKPATVPSTKSATVQSKKPATVPSTKPATVPSTKPATVQSTKPATVQPTKPATVQSTKPATVQSNQPATVQPTKVNKETVQKIQSQHANFHAQPNSAIASVQFNQNYQIRGAQNWQGNQYSAFRSYRPEWHDQGWWRSHHDRVELIGGGWYFWNGGYWYPAWGYDQSAAYYPYDGPIYSGPRARPLDQVVADVQAVLQEQGYYKGQVDGLVGPMTREALAAYQSAQGLQATAAIDEPTLDSLGLS